uniref:Amine oxidase domain-containing protein n=1 Tax=Clytia hemisphaerica TaxID=252671 RepID=A0A7M5X1J3_9CNID
RKRKRKRNHQKRMKKKTVLIIGAGICGLACARELTKHDAINVVVLEASNRIGGRIHSHTTEDGVSLELGAHYIHGTIGNPIYDFAVEKGIIEKTIEKQA